MSSKLVFCYNRYKTSNNDNNYKSQYQLFLYQQEFKNQFFSK